MTGDEIEHMIFKLLKNTAPDTQPEKLSPDDNIRQALDIDSFDFLQFIVGIDKSLGTDIPEEDYGKISTIRTLKEYLVEKVKQAKYG